MSLGVEQHGGGEHAPRPPANIAFYYDFASPESYLALERFAKSIAAFGPELVPVSAAELDPLPLPDDEARRANIEAVASTADVLPLVWPADFPDLDTADAVRAATYAKSIGKVAVFSLSLFRQIYAAGQDPANINTIYLAAAASEIHPRAIDQALSRDRVAEQTSAATDAARAAGVTSVPALRIGQRLLVGPALLHDATTVMREALEAFRDA
ncbi:MAG: DsbA family protein [Solirubrobacteraceae bacterium]|nr:DsbA family protein [Solirubrobacteraceae bacterium]